MLTLALVFGAGAVITLAAFLYLRHALDGPNASITVVDRRTMRSAKTRINKAMDTGDVARAYTGLTSLITWLRYEVQTGPRRYRVEYARELEVAELTKSQLAPALGLTGRETF